MRFNISVLALLLPLVTLAQEPKKESPLSFYGFVRNDFYLDTYKGVNAFHDLFYLYPNYIGVDANGEDINRQTSANLLSIVTRFGVNINGPQVFGAKTTGCIEADFAGKPEVYLLRLRKAYMQLNWEKSQLLVGQTWHPFWGGSAFPQTGSLNTGSPFSPFNRSPQVRFDYKIGHLTLNAAAIYQQQYVSSGPSGNSNIYKRDAVLPESVLGLEFNNNGVTLGAGLDYSSIKPRVTTAGSNGKIYKTDEVLGSMSYMAYGKYAKDKLMVLLKGYYGQNMSHLTMLGGYGVASYDATTGHETYTNYNAYYTVFNITYGKKWKPGLFVGYLKNLGTSDALHPFGAVGKETATTYGSATNIQNMYRVSPSIAYTVPKFSLVTEYEMTGANFGEGTFDFGDGLYSSTHLAVNHSLRLVMTYFF